MSKSTPKLQILSPNPVEVEEKCSAIIDMRDVQRYQDLGLGRAVNVTDPQMWRNKSSFLARKIIISQDHTNVIGTEEGGVKQKYNKEVSTVALHQQKIRLTLEDPNSLVKIGIDAQSSQSTSSAKKIAGTKVKTRTIAFQADFDDILMQCPKTPGLHTGYQRCTSEGNLFEDKLYTWILGRIKCRESNHSDLLEEEEEEPELNMTKKLLVKLKEMQSDDTKMKEIYNDCRDLVVTYGVTHYISAIKLGAMQYRVFTTSIKETKVGAGAEVGGGHMITGGLSGLSSKHWFHRCEEEQEIGSIGKDGRVKRRTTDEAVIGCQIQPLYKLVRIQYIQRALQEAIKDYIQAKEDTSGKNLEYKLLHLKQDCIKTELYVYEARLHIAHLELYIMLFKVLH